MKPYVPPKVNKAADLIIRLLVIDLAVSKNPVANMTPIPLPNNLCIYSQ